MKNANHGAIDNAQLKSIIERIEKLNEDTAAIAADTVSCHGAEGRRGRTGTAASTSRSAG